MLKNEQKALESISTLAGAMDSAATKKVGPSEVNAVLSPIVGQALVFALLAIAEAINNQDNTKIAEALESIAVEIPRAG